MRAVDLAKAIYNFRREEFKNGWVSFNFGVKGIVIGLKAFFGYYE